MMVTTSAGSVRESDGPLALIGTAFASGRSRATRDASDVVTDVMVETLTERGRLVALRIDRAPPTA